jgi:glycosyltransferase involved in cell wall biosynthesis
MIGSRISKLLKECDAGQRSSRRGDSSFRELPSASENGGRKKVCMVAYTAYEGDNRVRRYAETLVKRGDTVHVIAIGEAHLNQALKAEIKGVSVYKVQSREHDEQSKWSYLWPLLRFLWNSSKMVTRLHRVHHYDVIHIHNMPDFLVFAAWYPKLTGAKLILDIHDLVPELFATKFKTRHGALYVALLKAVEKASAHFVHHVIIANHLWYDTIVQRSIPRERCSVVVNYVDSELFARRQKTRNDDRYIVLFPGSLQWHQGLDIAIEAIGEIKLQVPNIEFHIYGGSGGDKAASLKQLTHRLGLEECVKFYTGVSLDEVVEVIANADLGVVPKRADSFGNEAYSTKIMEFMSQGVPVVASRTKIDSFYFKEGEVHFFTSGDSREMAKAMLEVIETRELRETLIANGLEYCERHGWAAKKKEYLDVVDLLSARPLVNAVPIRVRRTSTSVYRPVYAVAAAQSDTAGGSRDDASPIVEPIKKQS